MSWLKMTISAIDSAAILEDLLIVAMFVLIFTLPLLPILVL